LKVPDLGEKSNIYIGIYQIPLASKNRCGYTQMKI